MSAQRNFDRSKLQVPRGTIEDFHRPSHADFKTTSELTKEEFTGLRHNSLTDRLEIWMLGNIEAEISRVDIKLNKYAVQDKMEEIFALHATKEEGDK